MNLSEKEIGHRLIRLNNLEHLHAKARERIAFLETENKALKQRIRELEDKNNDQNLKIEALSFQFEQIKNKLFGKKPAANLSARKKKHVFRDSASYRRPIPKHITAIHRHSISACIHCHGALKNKSTTEFFEEDIPLPIQKTVVRHVVETGYCTACKQQSSSCFIPSKKAVLGENVRKYICVLSIANRLSHNQIHDHLNDVFDLKVSIGEIGNILEKEANGLRPEYQKLKESIVHQTGTHFDETGWPVQKEEQGKFAWVATGTENNDTVFDLGKSRGKGNIAGIGIPQVGISDDYGAYRNAFEEHQLCFAHPVRKLRDAAESGEIPEEKRVRCTKAYVQFSNLYHAIRKKIGHELSPYLKRKFQTDFDILSESHTLDPTPLAKIKMALRKNRDRYFTFLKHPGIPVDNNKAERALRHLVIKRKISLGSKTQRGAETTGILASIIMSLKWNDPGNWFKAYVALKP